MTVGQDVDAYIKKIKAAKTRLIKCDNKNKAQVKRLFEPIKKIMKECGETHWVFGFSDLKIHVEISNFGNRPQLNRFDYIAMVDLRHKHRWSADCHYDAWIYPESVEGDEITLSHFVNNYEGVLLAIVESMAKTAEEGADKHEALQEVGLLQ